MATIELRSCSCVIRVFIALHFRLVEFITPLLNILELWRQVQFFETGEIFCYALLSPVVIERAPETKPHKDGRVYAIDHHCDIPRENHREKHYGDHQQQGKDAVLSAVYERADIEMRKKKTQLHEEL